MKRILQFSIAIFCVFSVSICFAQRPNPSEGTRGEPARTPGYCDSWGGNISYEYISNVHWTIIGNTIRLYVDVYIANPTGCSSGNPCPEYDQSPEYVNGWIDFDGDNVWEPSEQVIDLQLRGYSNINYRGTMTGYAQETIPANHVRSTYMRVNLGWGGDPNNPCLSSWSWGNVVDYLIELPVYCVTNITVQNGIPIDNGISDDNVVWIQDFSGNCGVTNIRTEPKDNYPIAAIANRSLDLRVAIDRCPWGLEQSPTLSCRWSFNNGPSGFALPKAVTPVVWTRTVTVVTPSRVGIYTLSMDFEIRDPSTGQIAHQQHIDRKVLVTLGHPTMCLGWLCLPTPKRAWYWLACTWAQGAATESEVVQGVLAGIYAYGQANWLYYNGGSCNWQDLIDRTCIIAQCDKFSEVLEGMCGVLGVGGFSPVEEDGANDNGFVTKNGRTSLDDAFTGNARRDYGSPWDRYVFAWHSLRKKNGTFFDATYGRTYGSSRDFIDWDFKSTSNIETDQGAVVLPVFCPQNVLCNAYDSWGAFHYIPPPPLLTSLSGIIDGADVRWNDNLDSDNLSFTGNVSCSTIDENGDGIFEALAVDVEVSVIQQQGYLLQGHLHREGQLIANRPRFLSMVSSQSEYSGGTGIAVVHLEFSGEQIFRSGIDGPFNLKVIALSESGVEDSLQHITSTAYVHTAFGEIGAAVINVSDQGVDTDGDGDYNALRVNVQLSIRTAGLYAVWASLIKDSVTISNVAAQDSFTIGVHEMQIDFSGRDIHSKGLNGPFTVLLTLKDSTSSAIDGASHTTQPYQASDFDLALAPTGTHSDFGMDLNSNGQYDILRVQFAVSVDSAGVYSFTGWLGEGGSRASGSSETVFGEADTTITLTTGTHTISLDFSGLSISEHGTDGPFVLPIVDVHGVDLSLIGHFGVDFQTQAYAYTSFEGSSSTIVQYTGVHDDYAEDTNGNSRYDQLIVRMQATFASDGVILGFAELRDNDGRTIAQGSGYAAAGAGVPTMIPISFDGRYIFGNLRNGPYHIVNAFLYPSGDINLGVNVANVGLTDTYQYPTFEPAAVITGHVSSISSGVPATGATVSSSESVDFVDENGHYRLIYLTSGTKHFELSVPEFPSAEWAVYHNGIFIGVQSSANITLQIGKIDTVDFRTDHPLPVELLSFEASAGNGQVTLRWSTASELDIDRFEILRNSIRIASRRGAGTSTQHHDYLFVDSGLENGVEYTYTLISVDVNNIREELASVNAMPRAGASFITEYALYDNYPNPFNPTTEIAFDLPEAGHVSLRVYDIMGREVAVLVNGEKPAGHHNATFNARDLPSGLYICRMNAGSFAASRKMMLIR